MAEGRDWKQVATNLYALFGDISEYIDNLQMVPCEWCGKAAYYEDMCEDCDKRWCQTCVKERCPHNKEVDETKKRKTRPDDETKKRKTRPDDSFREMYKKLRENGGNKKLAW